MLKISYFNPGGNAPSYFLDTDNIPPDDPSHLFTYDRNGNCSNAGVNSEEYFRTLNQDFLRYAFAQGAFAPEWEIKTAQRQNLLDGKPALSEVQGAAKLKLLAPANAAAWRNAA